MKTIYTMQLHETIEVPDPSDPEEVFKNQIVTKVPGGWIYQSKMAGNSVFVPFVPDPNSQK